MRLSIKYKDNRPRRLSFAGRERETLALTRNQKPLPSVEKKKGEKRRREHQR